MKQRQPRELLTRINEHATTEYYSAGLDDWHWAALEAMRDARDALSKLPPEPPKRPKRPSYYGAKGSLRNPFHS
jgi:hypothetical protein